MDDTVKKEDANEKEIDDIDNLFKKSISEAYKGGYLDGMIAGLYAKGANFSDIAEFLKVDKDYVEKEIMDYLAMCKVSHRWAHMHPEVLKEEAKE